MGEGAIASVETEAMWLWEAEMCVLGFRRYPNHLWICKRRFGMYGGDHISVFNRDCKPVVDEQTAQRAVDVSAFHVTFERSSQRIHFYYSERDGNEWMPEGYTPSEHIRWLGYEPTSLRETADEIATAFVAALNGVLIGRDEP